MALLAFPSFCAMLVPKELEGVKIGEELGMLQRGSILKGVFRCE